MADLDRKDFEDRLWKTIDDVRIGMLGPVGGKPQHMQPMSAFAEPETRTVWFFLKRDNDLLKSTGPAMFCVVSKDREVYACLGGEISEQHDRARIDKYWGPVTAAWFPEGKDDPELTLLRLTVDDAQVWVAQKGPIKFAYEIAKANLTHKEPDVGDTAKLAFN